jgi:ankyrin repeat protein
VQIPSFTEILLKAGASVNMQGTEGYAPIHIAIFETNFPALQILCNYHVDLESQTDQGLTPLCIALLKKKFSIPHFLITKETSLNTVSFDRCTPLHIAVSSQSVLNTEALIEHGALLDMQNKDGNTPLHIATIHENKIIIDRLINAGADHTIKNNNGETVIEYAERKKLTGILKIFSKEIPLQTSLKLIEQKEEILEDPTDSFFAYKPPCHADLRLVKRYLHHQDSSHITDFNGETMLHQAALFGNKNLIQKLIAARAYINAPDEQGNTPLHKAISSFNPRIIQILLDAGADPLLKNNAGQTAQDIACLCLNKRKLFIVDEMKVSSETQRRYCIDSNKMQNIILALENSIQKKHAQNQTILEKKMPIFLMSRFYTISNPSPFFDIPLILQENP